ncbi:hypothetical protein AB1Y20_013303 [Prymnesium parvum]|uniref:Ubiquitin-like domain-containing protein n=1 Tax=Prymnesium parvum TaxID=97485 RepID=A0AB34IKU4_PRYPA
MSRRGLLLHLLVALCVRARGASLGLASAPSPLHTPPLSFPRPDGGLLGLRGGEAPSIVRLRTREGIKRLVLRSGELATVSELQAAVQRECKLPPAAQRLSHASGEPAEVDLTDGTRALSQLGIRHGTVLQLVEQAAAPPPPTAAGTRGARSVRRRGESMQEYLDKQAAREVLLKPPPDAPCAFCAIDARASKKFADFLLDDEFERMRFAILYGRYAADEAGRRGVQVDVMYEPPQKATSRAVELLTGAEAEAELARARTLAAALGLHEVGWAYAHPPRENAFNTYELAKMCTFRESAAAANPEASQLYVCVRFRPVYEGEEIDGDVTAEVYQPTEQCADLLRRGALQDSTKVAGEGVLKPELDLTFKLGIDLKESIDLAVFVSRVHNVARRYVSPLRTTFPYANRGISVRKLHLRKFVEKQRQADVPFLQFAADWQFLLHCSSILTAEDSEALCGAIASGGKSKKAQAALDNAERAICEYCNLPVRKV